MEMESEYANILQTVVENGRLVEWSEAELEAEIEFEASERNMSAEETAAAVAWALAHTETRETR